MSTNLTRALFAVPVAVLLMGAARLVDPPPVDTPAALSQKEVTSVVRKTLVKRGWMLTSDSGDVIAATLNVRAHVVKLKFTMADKRIRIGYVDSVNMDYKVNSKGEASIHKKYPAWINNLITAFQQEMQLAVLEKSN